MDRPTLTDEHRGAAGPKLQPILSDCYWLRPESCSNPLLGASNLLRRMLKQGRRLERGISYSSSRREPTSSLRLA